MDFDPVSNQTIGSAIEVHRHLGPGLLESVYEKALAFELASRGVKVAAQVPVPVSYNGTPWTAVFESICWSRIPSLWS